MKSAAKMLAAGALAAVLLIGRAGAQGPTVIETDRIGGVLSGDRRFAEFAADPEAWKLQLLLSVLTPPAVEGDPWLVERSAYRADAEYFYPASTIKLYAAIAAIRMLEETSRYHECPIGLETPLAFRPRFKGETLEEEDSSNTNGGAITAGHEIRKLFVVSDNRAFNRLYDLIGHRELNESMWAAGLESVRLAHRLSVARSLEQNRQTRAVELRCGLAEPVMIPERDSGLELSNTGVVGLSVGTANMVGGEKLDEPRSFEFSNYSSLADLHSALLMVLAPEAMPGGDRFMLSGEGRAFLSRAMEPYPRQSVNPEYAEADYPDDYVKFLLPGVRRVLPEDAIVIRGKIGLAYGFTVENSMVMDRRTGRAFVLTGCLYTNANGTMNDNTYEYDTVAMPFWADLGEAIARAVFTDPANKD